MGLGIGGSLAGEANPTITVDGLIVSGSATNICYWLNDETGVDGDTVLTNGPAGDQPGIYYNLQNGDIVWITQICYGLTTVSDSCTYELGYTDQAGAAGTFTPITVERHIATAVNVLGRQDEDLTITPPLGPLRYSDGIRSITFRVMQTMQMQVSTSVGTDS